MTKLPEAFQKRMRQMLGEEADAFFACYEEMPRRGLRVNPLKISAEAFEQIAPFSLEGIPWVENGYYYPEHVHPAQHPFYRAGLYYLQEPSAMTPADRLPVVPGDRVLDLCAAPGGKATQLAGKLGIGMAAQTEASGGTTVQYADNGLLVANEISSSRAKALLRNLELAGARGCFVTNEHAGNLAEVFPEYFDKILVDAPCSGEGMFRRQQEVADAWSEERVAYFASLQKSILEQAVRMLRPGGLMMYSTCTFSPDENEGTITHFLKRHSEMQLIEIEPYEGFSPGRDFSGVTEDDEADHAGVTEDGETDHAGVTEDGEADHAGVTEDGEADHAGVTADGKIDYAGAAEDSKMDAAAMTKEDSRIDLQKCVRIWPHKMDGEGHFMALMQKCADGEAFSPLPVEKRDNPDCRDVKCGKRGNADRRDAKRGACDNADRRDAKRRARGKADRRDAKRGKRSKTDRRNGNSREQAAAMEALGRFLEETGICLPENQTIDIRGGRLYLVAELPAYVQGLKFIRNGVFLGEVRKDRFEPSQPFAMILSAADCSPDAVICFDGDDPRLQTYLGGLTISFDAAESMPGVESCGQKEADCGEKEPDCSQKEVNCGEKEADCEQKEADCGQKGAMQTQGVPAPVRQIKNGWKLICAGRYGLGWARYAAGILKNKYPVSWR